MKTKLLDWLQTDPNVDPKYSRMLTTIHIIVLTAMIAVIIITNTITKTSVAFWILSSLSVLVAISTVLTYRGYFLPGRILVPVGLIGAITIMVFNGLGMHDTAMVAFSCALLLGGILVGRHGLWAFTLLSMSAVAFIGLSEMNGILVTPLRARTGWDDILINYALLIATSSALNLVMKRMEESLDVARKNEQAWRLSEEHFRVFMETSPAVVIMKDENSRFAYCNPKAESLFGKPVSELLGRTEFELFPRDEAERFTESDHLVLRTDQALEQEFEAHLPNGEIRNWWVFKFPMHASTGRRFVGIQILDVTERKQAENALARERDLLQALMASIPDTVYFKDTASRFTRVNHLQARMLGVDSPDDAIGRTDADFMPLHLAEAFMEEEQDLIRTGRVLLDRVEYNPYPDGTPRWLSASKAPLIDKNRSIVGLVGISRDITERKLAEIEREKLIHDLEARNAELERFTYTVSHDLKSPIVTIQGFLGFLEKDALSGDLERVRHDSQRIISATNKMQKLLKELLELSRIGRLMNAPEETPLHMIIQEALSNVDGQIQNGSIRVSIAAGLPNVYGDKARLVEVIQNLLDNACKYMGDQPDPWVEIGCQLSSDQTTVFFVRDNGMGIDPKYHQRIFGLFDKLDPKTEGTGVGLALVKRIIEVHGGRIWVESDGNGHGSIFFFTLAGSPHSLHH